MSTLNHAQLALLAAARSTGPLPSVDTGDLNSAVDAVVSAQKVQRWNLPLCELQSGKSKDLSF